jgi:hypothetical protein
LQRLLSTYDIAGRTQVGNVLSAAGALGGFAAQQAVWRCCIEPNHQNAGDFLVNVGTKTGETFYLGEAINRFLVDTNQGRKSFWSFVAGAVPNPGPETLPDLTEIFRHVVKTFGTPAFGVVRLPQLHGLFDPPCATLRKNWEWAEKMLVEAGNSPSEWPVILGFVAHRTIVGARKMSDRLPPSVAVRLVMEAAIFSSKLDPRTVPGVGAGMSPPKEWSHRALRPETQDAVMAEVLPLLPTKIPA